MNHEHHEPHENAVLLLIGDLLSALCSAIAWGFVANLLFRLFQ